MKTEFGHLTYCSNIHPGVNWDAHFHELKTHLPQIRKELADGQPFALGLRLAHEASLELIKPDRLSEFKSWLSENDLYVFTMNGFPYGSFHDSIVKDQVHSPDWTTAERRDYTIRLFDVLAQLVPDGMTGTVSTPPLSYRFWWDGADALEEATRKGTLHMLEVVKHLAELEKTSGKVLHLDIEPEPDGILDNGADFLDWYRNTLLSLGVPYLVEVLSVDDEQAKELILHHIRLCFDVCHFAVSYEDPEEYLKQLDAAGIKVGKIQVSSALQVVWGENDLDKMEAISQFNEPVYLHQVVARKEDGSLEHFVDLNEGIAAYDETHAEWRVHFHVPLFLETYGLLNSTQFQISKVLDLQKKRPFSDYLEVETYTWGVLPADLQKPIAESIIREVKWVKDRLI